MAETLNGTKELPLFHGMANKKAIVRAVIEEESQNGGNLGDRKRVLELAALRMQEYPAHQRVPVTRHDVDNGFYQLRLTTGNASAYSKAPEFNGRVSKAEIVRRVIKEEGVNIDDNVDYATLHFLCDKKLQEYPEEKRPEISKEALRKVVSSLRYQPHRLTVGMRISGRKAVPVREGKLSKIEVVRQVVQEYNLDFGEGTPNYSHLMELIQRKLQEYPEDKRPDFTLGALHKAVAEFRSGLNKKGKSEKPPEDTTLRVTDKSYTHTELLKALDFVAQMSSADRAKELIGLVTLMRK